MWCCSSSHPSCVAAVAVDSSSERGGLVGTAQITAGKGQESSPHSKDCARVGFPLPQDQFLYIDSIFPRRDGAILRGIECSDISSPQFQDPSKKNQASSADLSSNVGKPTPQLATFNSPVECGNGDPRKQSESPERIGLVGILISNSSVDKMHGNVHDKINALKENSDVESLKALKNSTQAQQRGDFAGVEQSGVQDVHQVSDSLPMRILQASQCERQCSEGVMKG